MHLHMLAPSTRARIKIKVVLFKLGTGAFQA
jgi:hypothetical protein